MSTSMTNNSGLCRRLGYSYVHLKLGPEGVGTGSSFTYSTKVHAILYQHNMNVSCWEGRCKPVCKLLFFLLAKQCVFQSVMPRVRIYHMYMYVAVLVSHDDVAVTKP